MRKRQHATHITGNRFKDDYSPSNKFSNTYKNNGKRGKKRIKRKETLQELIDSNNAKPKRISKNKIYISYLPSKKK